MIKYFKEIQKKFCSDLFYAATRGYITMKYNVMLKILMTLLQNKRTTATELASKYDISVRSVYRYVEEMIICGVPVDMARGRYGGISVADTFKLPSGYFTREEYAAMVNALNAMASQINDKNLISAKEKLESREKHEKSGLSVSGHIIVDGGAWADGGKFSEKMRVCEQAANEGKSILIDYISRGGEHSKRVIDPHALIFKQNVWYVWAFCHTKQDFRTFKIGRIKSATFTGASFEKKQFTRADIDLDFDGGKSELVEVTLKIDKNSLADAEEWLGIDNIEPRCNGFVANITLPDDGGLISKILSYGGAVSVVSPPSLKARVKSAAKIILEND